MISMKGVDQNVKAEIAATIWPQSGRLSQNAKTFVCISFAAYSTAAEMSDAAKFGVYVEEWAS